MDHNHLQLQLQEIQHRCGPAHVWTYSHTNTHLIFLKLKKIMAVVISETARPS